VANTTPPVVRRLTPEELTALETKRLYAALEDANAMHARRHSMKTLMARDVAKARFRMHCEMLAKLALEPRP
jgi:hypothetical protein